jgi:quaternary ammonium compound-resistance protein SugE
VTQGTAWILLIMAGLLDAAWAVSMKYADGYTKFGWTVISLLLLAAFVYLLGKTLTVLPVGTAYAVWSGIGAAGAVILGILLFGEALSPVRIAGIALVVAGIVVLRSVPG